MSRALAIAVSGVNSDPDPSPGVGIALSLREAFPKATLIGVDYSVRSSGLHHPVFDQVLVQPTWAEVDLETYAQQVRSHLALPRGCWFSGLDVEVAWLANSLGPHPRLFVPHVDSQLAVQKPGLSCAPELKMRVPESLPAFSSMEDLHALGRRSGWQLWVKGRYHEAYFADGFESLRQRLRALELHWPLDQVFVQRSVAGLEQSIAFAALQGRLLGAAAVEKRSITAQGKTWAAAVQPLSEDARNRLSSLVARLSWTGGGEVEFVRDASGVDWLIDFNPRFPAYVYGLVVCGLNLPAQLVAAALDLRLRRSRQAAGQFVRVVHEVPVREEFPLPRLAADGKATSPGKHPSYQPQLVQRMRDAGARWSRPRSAELPVRADLAASVDTPSRIRDTVHLREVVAAIKQSVDRCASILAIIPALSIKTDPHPSLANAFLERNWWAEVISVAELDYVISLGFPPSRIVFNGPSAALLPSFEGPRIGAVFADSAEAFEHISEADVADTIGLRINPFSGASRFGVRLDSHRTFKRVSSCLRRSGLGRRLGFHMHVSSDAIGPTQWRDAFDHALTWAGSLAQASGVQFTLFDCGGGWSAKEFVEILLPSLGALSSRVASAMPSIEALLIEPGKALAAESAWLATKVIEVRASEGSDTDVVVDASVADLPMAAQYAHRILHFRAGVCRGWLTRGRCRILGAICMESDILADNVEFPVRPLAGDTLLISSAGGYNASMAWNFGRGSSRDSA